MIQRIQSLYLLLVTALMALTLLLPIASFTGSNDEVYTLTAFALTGGGASQSSIWLGVILAIAAVVPFITIFLFKNRLLQLRLCAVEIILLLGAVAFIAIYFWLSGSNALEDIGVAHRQFGWAAIMPIPSIIIMLLAARAIFKDEALVRSLDRIR